MKTLYSLVFFFKTTEDEGFWDSYLTNDFAFHVNRQLRTLDRGKNVAKDAKIQFSVDSTVPVEGGYMRRVTFNKFASAEEAVAFYNLVMDENTDWYNVNTNLQNMPEMVNVKPMAELGFFFNFDLLIRSLVEWANDNGADMYVAVMPTYYDGVDPDTGLSIFASRDYGNAQVLSGTAFDSDPLIFTP